jgi:hypothetical protein
MSVLSRSWHTRGMRKLWTTKDVGGLAMASYIIWNEVGRKAS